MSQKFKVVGASKIYNLLKPPKALSTTWKSQLKACNMYDTILKIWKGKLVSVADVGRLAFTEALNDVRLISFVLFTIMYACVKHMALGTPKATVQIGLGISEATWRIYIKYGKIVAKFQSVAVLFTPQDIKTTYQLKTPTKTGFISLMTLLNKIDNYASRKVRRKLKQRTKWKLHTIL